MAGCGERCLNLSVSVPVAGLLGMEAIHHPESAVRFDRFATVILWQVRVTRPTALLRMTDSSKPIVCPYSCTDRPSDHPTIRPSLYMHTFCLLAYFCSTSEINLVTKYSPVML
jgi:hypothetical protein